MKTFRSKRCGFEIDIPEEWSCPPTNFIRRLLGLDKNLNFKGRRGKSLNIQVGPLFPEPSISETEISFKEYAEDLGYTDVETGIIRVGGKDHFCARYAIGETEPDSAILWMLKDTGMKKEDYEIPEMPEELEVVCKKYCLVFRGIEYSITCSLGLKAEKKIFKEEEAFYDAIVSTFRLIKR